MSADPYGGSMSLANPGSLNRYAYVNGDPVNFNDPSGLVGHCPAGMHTDSTGMGCEPDGVNFEYLISSPGWLFWLGVGGAGASGGGAVAATPAEVARREMSKVAPIATDALKNNDCLGLFGSGAKDPKEILNTMITTASYKDKGTSYVARYNTVTGSLTINTHTGPEATYWNTSWSLQALEDAVTLLHELGHATSKNAGNQFINDTSLFGKTDPAKAWTNDELIWTKCFGREDPFPKP